MTVDAAIAEVAKKAGDVLAQRLDNLTLQLIQDGADEASTAATVEAQRTADLEWLAATLARLRVELETFARGDTVH
jgi:hypothetical protein